MFFPKINSSSNIATCCLLIFCCWSFFVFCLCFTTDSNPNCSANSEGGPPGLPKAVAGAHSHSARVSKGSGWLATAQSATYLLPCHKNAGIQAPGTGQKAFPGCKSILLCFCGKSFFKNSCHSSSGSNLGSFNILCGFFPLCAVPPYTV